MSYTKEQIDALTKYYPCSDYDSLEKYFPGMTKRKIMEIAHSHGIKNNNPGHRTDLTGKIFDRLTVIEIDHISSNHVVYWKCKCICGNEAVVNTSSLTKGHTKSCGCLNRENISKGTSVDHTGEKFGMLTAIERIPNYNGKGRTYYRCICDCGNEKYVLGSGLVCGKAKTCGCLSRKPTEFKKAFDIKSDDTIHKYIIYKHTTPSGKVYIGITKQNADRRWQNGNGYNTQKKFWRAIQKYGWENISHEILDENLTEKEACEKEILYIIQYKSTDSKYGYNVAEGGETGRKLVTPIMQYYKGEPVNFFESQQHAASLLGVSDSSVQNYVTGKNMIEGYHFEKMEPIHTYDIDVDLYNIRSEEHLKIGKLLKEQLRQKTIARNKANVRSICQYDMDGHFIQSFSSIEEAKRNTDGLGSINAVLNGRGKSKSAGGYQWRYDDGNHSDIPALHVNGRPVIQIDPRTYEIIAEYYSMAEAERKTGIKNKQILKSCKRINITSGGYIWRYKDDPNAFARVEKKQPARQCISINQYSLDGEYITTYKSITEAEIMNPNINGIRSAVSKNSINKSAGGYMWCLNNGNQENIKPYHANGRLIEQIDISTGIVIKKFPSIRAASKETGINNIAAVCTGKRKKAGGYLWRYSQEE